jgi:adenylate cyclase
MRLVSQTPAPAVRAGRPLVVGTKPPYARKIVQWIAEQATVLDDVVTLLDGFCRALSDGGLPLWRMSAVVPAIDPSVRGFSFDWERDRGASLVSAAFSAEGINAFERSPLYALLAEGRTFARWRLHDDLDTTIAVPALLDLRAEGGTDYVLHLIWFTPGTALKGAAISFATDAASGFSDDDMAALAEVVPARDLSRFANEYAGARGTDPARRRRNGRRRHPAGRFPRFHDAHRS